MPFVLRKVEPYYVNRGHVPGGATSRDWPVGAELEAVANGALAASLKQLASVMATAEDIFGLLTAELTGIAERSGRLRSRIDRVEERLAQVDPKKITVPQSDICTFAARTDHFRQKKEVTTSLFTLASRPKALKKLYDSAAACVVRNLDSLRREGDAKSMDLFLCTPVFNRKEKERRRDQSLDIESRVPRAIEDLRRWTSAEALGDVTTAPDSSKVVLKPIATDVAVDHKLPSPEEQLQAIALKFPAEIVAVDVSGRSFRRMSIRRRSLHAGQEGQENVKRRSRPRRPRGKRRNTIAGTDQKEIRQAVGGDATADETEESQASRSPRTHRSASTDLLGSNKESSPTEKKSHFNSIKAWGMSRLKLISPKSNGQAIQSLQQQAPVCQSTTLRRLTKDVEASPTSSEQAHSVDSEEIRLRPRDHESHTNNVNRRSKRDSKTLSHERKPSSSSSSGKSTSSLPPPSLPPAVQRHSTSSSVRLRESAALRREKRKANRAEEQPHSSSGNWSASSESGRASIGSETTTNPPRSTTASVGTSSTSLCHARRFRGRPDTSASSSVTSEGTLTPDIIQDVAVMPFSDDGETSSVYSCDTEGYYTSFHMDSGLKTLREEEGLPSSPLTRSNETNSDPTSPVAENEYELYGRGSTSTTTSSAGTVCTTLLAPPPPERKSSLTVVAVVHKQKQQQCNGGESPDSGHNTSSSPVESASSPAFTGRSCSEFEYSESSDLEGCDRIERIRTKTAINTSRIPSMCIITPTNSDDESRKVADDKQQSLEKADNQQLHKQAGAVLMSATVGTSKMEVINGEDKNLYATVQTVSATAQTTLSTGPGDKVTKTSPLSGVLGKLRGVLPGKKHQQKPQLQDLASSDIIVSNTINNQPQIDSGDYVTIADVRNNNNINDSTPVDSMPECATYANSDLFRRDAEYVSLSELPMKNDSSLERRRQGARVTLDSDGKVVFSSDSLRRRRAAHTTFIPGPFVKDKTSSPTASPLLHRAAVTPRAVQKTTTIVDKVDGIESKSIDQQLQQQLSKLTINSDCQKVPTVASAASNITPTATVVTPTKLRGAYVNVQGEEDKPVLDEQPPDNPPPNPPPPYVDPPKISQQPNPIRDSRLESIQAVYQQNIPRTNQVRLPYHQKFQPIQQPQQFYPRPNNCNLPQRRFINHHQIANLRAQQQEAKHQQFFTLPNRRPLTVRDMNGTPKSTNPDVTRGLARNPHLLMMQTRPTYAVPNKLITQNANEQAMNLQNLQMNGNHVNAAGRLIQHQNPTLMEMKNSFPSPAAVAYHPFNSPIPDTLVNVPISPISPALTNGFKSSTPTGRTTPTVAERLALQASRRFSPNPVLMSPSGRHTPVIGEKGIVGSSGGRLAVPPSNLVLSPTRSTMSNEELFAAIHKSKKRLNIREDGDSLSPASSCGSLPGVNVIGTRHSWSPESQKAPDIPKTVFSPTSTSRMDFKRLLLQQSVKAMPSRISAVEQLKLNAHQQQQHQQQLLEHHQQQIIYQQLPPPKPIIAIPLSKVMSPRSAWRFHTPRTDVLSSTIIEDTAAEEKAMKPSPENSLSPQPVDNKKLSPRRLLELSNNAGVNKKFVKLDKSEKEIENHLSSNKLMALVQNLQQKHSGENNPVKAIENRRISNQLARAQFLAANSSPPNAEIDGKDLFAKRFRARSESPQQGAAQNSVIRSPSAPALETAL